MYGKYIVFALKIALISEELNKENTENLRKGYMLGFQNILLDRNLLHKYDFSKKNMVKLLGVLQDYNNPKNYPNTYISKIMSSTAKTVCQIYRQFPR